MTPPLTPPHVGTHGEVGEVSEYTRRAYGELLVAIAEWLASSALRSVQREEVLEGV